MKGKVAALIVNYNGERFLIDCINSIKSQSYQGIDIILVDNHSADGSVALVERNFPEVIILRQKENKGFSGGNNVGIKYALREKYEYLLLINEDTIIDREMVSRLMQSANRETAVIPTIYIDSGLQKKWYAGGRLDFDNGVALSTAFLQVQEPVEVTFMTGCCMLLHREILERVGLLDENYFLYFEDVDYSMKMYLNHIRMIYVPDTWVWHRIGRRERRADDFYYTTRNQLYFINKYRLYFKISPAELLFKLLKERVLFPNAADAPFCKHALQGIWDYLRGNLYQRSL